MQTIINFIQGTLAVLITFGLAVFVHEFGHMIFALMRGVGVESFALGMGPKIRGCVWMWRGIEFSLRWFPVGGFVKLKGLIREEEPAAAEGKEVNVKDAALVNVVTEEKKDNAPAAAETATDEKPKDLGESAYDDLFALYDKGLLTKILVFGGGVFMNFVTAIVAMGLYLWLPREVNLIRLEAETVTTHSLAQQAGLQPGDQIVGANGQKIEYLTDLDTWAEKQMSEAGNQQRAMANLVFTVSRNQALHEISLADMTQGEVDGLIKGVEFTKPAVVGNAPKFTLARKMGLQRGDRIESVNGKAVADFNALTEALKADAGQQPTMLQVLRGKATRSGQPKYEVLSMEVPAGKKLELKEPEGMLQVKNVQAGVPEAANELLPGDIILGLNNQRLNKADDIREQYQEALAEPVLKMLTLDVNRQGQPVQLAMSNVDVNYLGQFINGFELRTPPVIDQLIPNQPADKAGLQKGDRILAVNNQPVKSFREMAEIVTANPEKAINIQYERNGQRDTVTLTPTTSYEDQSRGAIGITPGADAVRTEREPNILKAMAMAPGRTVDMLAMIVQLNIDFFSKASFSQIRENVGGPIAIATMTVKSAQQGFSSAVRWFILLNLLLLVFNLLPVPVLDGGFILISIIEAIMRRPVPVKILDPIYRVFMFGFLALMVLISVQDIINWVF